MNVGFTGTRKGMSERQKKELEDWFEEHYDSYEDSPNYLAEFHHGDCEGADEAAHELAGYYFKKRVVHPPLDPKYRAYTISDMTPLYLPKEYGYRQPKEYLARNHDIVDECAILIAAPQFAFEELRSGTWATVRYARQQGKPVVILEP
jgi:hypothetical protein